MIIHTTTGLNHWWNKYQCIKKLLEVYMKTNKIKNVEEAIENLISTVGTQ